MRPYSIISPEWWDYTTLNKDLLEDVYKLTEKDILKFSRQGFEIKLYDNIESFYLSEAMEYINCWKQSSSTNPKGICGPIGPTEQLPIVAQIINELQIDVRDGHFWGMDEWYMRDKGIIENNPLSFTKAHLDLCFNRIDKRYRIPDENLHFLSPDSIKQYSESFNQIECLIMQGGQGESKHWAFNDPVRRIGKFKEAPPKPEEYRNLGARVVDLHPLTIIQNARTSGQGAVFKVPAKAITVGPVETWKSEKVSIWLPGTHDSSFGIRLTSYMISKRIVDLSVPMSLLSDHPNVQFNIYRPAISTCTPELH
jgi:glucosamine-6-phosphate deaminase